MPVNTWINKYITFDIGNSMNWEEPQTRMHILHAAHAQAAGAYIHCISAHKEHWRLSSNFAFIL